MRLRTIIALLSAGMIATSAAAETTVRVSFLDESRPDVTVGITPESKLIFGGSPHFNFSNCVGPTADESINVANVKRITFQGSWMGVESARVESSIQLKENPVGAYLGVEAYNGAATTLSVYSISGREAVRVERWKGEDVDVSRLPSGLYILHINQSTIKFIKK